GGAAGAGSLEGAGQLGYRCDVSDFFVTACVTPAVSGANDGLVFSEPRKRPAQADGWSEVVPVVVEESFVRIRRIFSDKFNRGERAARNAAQPRFTADGLSSAPLAFLWNSEPVIVNAKIQRESGTDLP